MRAFELLLLLACAAFSIRLAGGRAAGWTHSIQLVLTLALLAQVVLEGWRWQILPAYAAAFVVALTPVFLSQSALALLCSAVVTCSLLGASIAACLVFPFAAPREPLGSFGVGTSAIRVTVAHSGSEPAELQALPQVQLWYPTQSSNYRHRVLAALAARAAHGFRARATAAASPDAPVATQGRKFPVIVYFDGWPEDKTQNVNLILELASRGFAVAAVTYRGIDRPLVEYSSDAAMQRSVDLDHERTRAHARDGAAILDTLGSLDSRAEGRFAGTLDTQHVGALGFSFGGAVAAQLARVDSRVKSAVNLDGRHWAEGLESGVSKPYMFICETLIVPSDADVSSPEPSIRYEARLDRIDYAQLDRNQAANGGIRVTLPGVAHMNFTDVPLRSPFKRFSSGGELDARRVQDITRAYVIEFFERYVRPGREPLPLEAPWPHFPEAQLRIWPAPH
jgi:dienelactone hydrolase